MATSKKVILYQQSSNVFYKTIDNQRVPHVNVRVEEKNKAPVNVVMTLESFNDKGYSIDPKRVPKIIVIDTPDGIDRISVDDGSKHTVYQKIGNYKSQGIEYVNVRKTEDNLPPRIVKMTLEKFLKLKEIEEPEDIIILEIKNYKRKIKGMINRIYEIEPYPLTVSTADHIADWGFNLMQKIIQEAATQNAGGHILRFNMIYKTNTNYFSNKFGDNDSLEKFIQKTESSARKNYDTKDYIAYLSRVDVLIIGLAVEGGCSSKNSKVEKIIDKKYQKVSAFSPKSTNNNCLFAIFNLVSEYKSNVHKPDGIRKKLGISLGSKISIEQFPLVADYYKKNYILLNEKMEPLLTKSYDQGPINYLLLRNDHYFILDIKDYKNCNKCGKNINVNLGHKHKCSVSSVSYKQRKLLGKKDVVKVRKITEDNKIDYDKLIHLDLETFQETVRHVPYACGWYNNEYKYTYGKNCFGTFLDEMLQEKDKTISAYNGSGFDFFFLLDRITERGLAVENMIISNGKLLTFTFGNNIKIFDLFLFLSPKSLEEACEDFKIKNKKSYFNHKLIKSWEDTETHKEEVQGYLKKDVEALKELFEAFNDIIFELCKVNICRFITISHMAYEIWSSMLKEIVEIPTCLEKYNFIQLAKYGGRCYPLQQNYKSKLYNDVVTGKITWSQLLESEDFIFNSDASGLYPASMSGIDLMKVEYPIGDSRWSDQPEVEWKNNKIGFYKIKYFPPKNIRVAILPKRCNLGISWDLLDGEGVYTSVDIQNAIDANYRVEFVDKCLVYDKTGDLFGEFINKFADIKYNAQKSHNDSLRGVAKIVMCALYGKTLQKAIFTKNKIVGDIFELRNFARKYGNNLEWKFLNDGKILLTGEAYDADKEKYITKPCQLGCFVTSYSRRLMLLFMKAVDPTLQTLIFTYTDTDSLHILASAYFKLRKIGYITDKENSKLGYLCSDIKNEGLIIYEKNLGPKCYNYHYIDNKNKVVTKDEDEITRCNDCVTKDKLCKICKSVCAVKKCKGIPQHKLKNSFYDIGEPEVIHFDGLKRKHTTLTYEDVEKGVKHFSIVDNKLERTFMKNPWKAMTLHNNEYYPIGYEFPK